MKLLFTKNFIRDYRKLPEDVKTALDKQLELLLANSMQPSLAVKIMNDPRGIREGQVTAAYRFTFQIEGDIYIMRKGGTHDILKSP